MLSVDARVESVERDLREGRLRCPACDGELGPWGHARERKLREGGALMWLRPRRSRCRTCLVTHVLLPVIALLRRMDLAEMIGRALEARASGSGHRRIARTLGIPVTTVRSWLARFASVAEAIRVFFTGLALSLDPMLSRIEPTASTFADAVEAIAQAARAGSRRFGPRPAWQFASGATAGGLLSNTRWRLPAAF
jgi:hypothetical protein